MASDGHIFAPALAELAASGERCRDFGTFRAYVDQHAVKAGATAASISIDDWSRLPAPMKQASTMVLRLGVGGTKGRTRFALVEVDDVRDFFLFHDDSSEAETFLSPASLRSLFGYSIIRPGEKTLVNLAFASGLLAFALRLDETVSLPAPATGALTADFRFRPHPTIDADLDHRAGQVEVDAVFVARRDDRETLFVVEAKTDTPPLAKHKLVYPVLGLISRVPADIPVVPVYLRAWLSAGGFNFRVAECHLPDPREQPTTLSDLSVSTARHLRLPLLGQE